MNKQLLAQLRAKHKAAEACLDLIDNATDADMKNIAGKWYESFLIDIVEMQVPESEKPEYHNLEMSLSDDFDYAIAEEEERSRIKVPVPSVSHNLSYQ